MSKRISELPTISALSGTEELPVIQGGVTKKLTVDDIVTRTEVAGDVVSATSLAAPSGSSLVGFIQSGTGAVARTAQSKMRDIVSVTDFDAKLDGVTDDITAINNTVAALVIAGGGDVFFPEGTCLINGQVNIRDNITYRGTGWGSIIKSKSTSDKNVFGHSGAEYDFDISNVVIRDLAIDGNQTNCSYNTLGGGGSSDDSYQNGIRLHRVMDFRIDNVYVHDTVNNGISVYNTSSRGRISRCRIDTIGKAGGVAFSHNGVFVESTTTDITITDNTINACKQMGVYVNAHDGTNYDTRIIGNRIIGSGTNGIGIGQASGKTSTINDPIVIGNVVAGGTSVADPAIYVFTHAASGGVVGAIITGNRVRGNAYRGIQVDETSTGTVQSSVVSGNIVTINTGVGILVNGTDTLVYGNISLSNTAGNYSNSGDRTVKYGNIFDQTSGGFSASGTTTNDSAAAGDIGEILTASIASAGALSVTNGAPLNITSVSLTAGDWDVEGLAVINPAATTTFGYMQAGVTITSATLVTDQYAQQSYASGTAFGGNTLQIPTNTRRISLSATTTVYLVTVCGFGTSTCTAWGSIRARRVR